MQPGFNDSLANYFVDIKQVIVLFLLGWWAGGRVRQPSCRNGFDGRNTPVWRVRTRSSFSGYGAQ